MSRYIDAEWIKGVYADFKDYKGRDDWTTPISNVLAVIDDAPSIDIVRCKEYKSWLKYDIMPICRKNAGLWRADDFCLYGEREG